MNIIEAKEVMLTEHHLALSMEYAACGSLTGYVAERWQDAQRTGLFLGENEARYFFRVCLMPAVMRISLRRLLLLQDRARSGSEPLLGQLQGCFRQRLQLAQQSDAQPTCRRGIAERGTAARCSGLTLTLPCSNSWTQCPTATSTTWHTGALAALAALPCWQHHDKLRLVFVAEI